MKLWDLFRGYSVTREVQAVFDKDNIAFTPHVVINYLGLDGKVIQTSICGKLNNRERSEYLENPKDVARSAFSYVPENQLNLPREFAKTMRDIREFGINKK